MSAPQRTPDRIEEFISSFFGPGNTVWPDGDPDSTAGRRLVPYLQVLRDQSEVPVVLPRRRPEDDQRLTAYVIALNAAHAAALAELLTAFVGPSFSAFDGLPAQLDPADPVDQAVTRLRRARSGVHAVQPDPGIAGRSLERAPSTAGRHEAAPGAFLARAQADRATAGRIRGRAGRGRQLGVRGPARATGRQRRAERHQPCPPAGQAPGATRTRWGTAPDGLPRQRGDRESARPGQGRGTRGHLLPYGLRTAQSGRPGRRPGKTDRRRSARARADQRPSVRAQRARH